MARGLDRTSTHLVAVVFPACGHTYEIYVSGKAPEQARTVAAAQRVYAGQCPPCHNTPCVKAA